MLSHLPPSRPKGPQPSSPVAPPLMDSGSSCLCIGGEDTLPHHSESDFPVVPPPLGSGSSRRAWYKRRGYGGVYERWAIYLNRIVRKRLRNCESVGGDGSERRVEGGKGYRSLRDTRQIAMAYDTALLTQGF